jgi:radical S-adenosyl methionine domain-containing protein 2
VCVPAWNSESAVQRTARQRSPNSFLTVSPTMELAIIISAIVILVSAIFYKRWRRQRTPFAVNYHFTRECNFKCGFCFHTALTSHVEKIDKIKPALRALKDAGMKKINFAGGEPFLKPKLLGQMCQFCKEELGLTVSIVSNGSLIKEKWMKEFGKFVDMLAISCDSFDEGVNTKIGRSENGKPGNQLRHAERAATWCQQYGIKFKINTVVNTFNWEEDMNKLISELNPVRWKVFQCLIIGGENDGGNSKRDAQKFVVSEDQFNAFLKRHSDQKCLVPEDNNTMRTSYLILDEFMRFLDCSGNSKVPGPTILGMENVHEALKLAGFDEEKFRQRGGDFFLKEWVTTNGAKSATETPSGGCSSSGTSGGSIADIEDIASH